MVTEEGTGNVAQCGGRKGCSGVEQGSVSRGSGWRPWWDRMLRAIMREWHINRCIRVWSRMSGEAGTASEGTCLPRSVALGACGDQRGDRAIGTVGWMARDGSQALHPRSPLSGAAGPGSEGGGVSRGFGPAVEDTGWPRPGSCPPAGGAAGVVTAERLGPELGLPSMLPHVPPAHQLLLFFRTSSVKDSSFVEKMKKTVSFLCVCALCGGSRPWQPGEGGPAEGQLHWSGGKSGLEHSHLTFSKRQRCSAFLGQFTL